jgi:bisphosphoglycerate-independent phosphoglycerate mutase (AlkP superfamily)
VRIYKVTSLDEGVRAVTSEDLRKALTIKKRTQNIVVHNFTEDRFKELFNWWESDKVGTFQEID